MRVFLFATVIAMQTIVCSADEKDLVAIHVFRREKAPEMVYAIDKEEIDRLKGTEGWDYRGILGYGSSKDGEGLIKLQRAHRGRWHVFYTKAPKKLPKGTELEEFDVWVWEKEADGLVPVYGASLSDWRDMIYSTDKAVVKRESDKTYNATKVRRKQHGIVFYLKPAEE